MLCPKLFLICSAFCLLFVKLEGQQAYGGGGYSASGVAPSAGTGYEQGQGTGAQPPPPQSAPAAPSAPSAPLSPPPSSAGPSRPASSPVEAGYGAGGTPDSSKSRTHGTGNLGFPLPSCYINADGFLCCNKELENLMSNTYRNISQSRGGKWKKCNIHQVAVATQRNAEKHFGVDFELVVGAGDYASKNYFNQDLICKIKRDNSIILAFATPTL